MFGRSKTLFKLLGFEIRMDPSWLIIAVLIAWSLATGIFPGYYRGLPAAVYWWMGAAGALGLFASIIFHELCHSLVARRFGLPMRGITLFIFGGVAEMEEEPPSAKAEFFMAVAGPVSSVALGLVFHAAHNVLPRTTGTIAAIGVLGYLSWLNFILAVFNLLPAFPLDGGRVLRSVLWRWKRNLRWATHVSSRIGAGFGFMLSFLGVLNMLRGAFIGGLWWLLIGMFLRNAAQMSYQRLLMRDALQGEAVRRFMRADPVTAPSSLSLEELVEEYIYKHHYKMIPVVDEGELAGCVSTREIREIPRREWKERRVKEILKPCSAGNTVSGDLDAMKALSLMNQTGNSRLMVVENKRLVGIVTLKDLLRFLSLKFDLEGERFSPGA